MPLHPQIEPTMGLVLPKKEKPFRPNVPHVPTYNPDGTRRSRVPEDKMCGAHKKNGELCRNPGNGQGGRCKFHGGRSLVGVASPQLRDARRSKHLPTRLSTKYEEALADPELLSSRQDLALLETRLTDVLDGLTASTSGELWVDLQQALTRYDVSVTRNSMQERATAWNEIRRLITSGHSEQQNWREARQILQERKSLAESERKRLIDMQHSISVTQANVLLGAIAQIVKTHVTDRAALAAIAADLGKLVNHGSDEGARSVN